MNAESLGDLGLEEPEGGANGVLLDDVDEGVEGREGFAVGLEERVGGSGGI